MRLKGVTMLRKLAWALAMLGLSVSTGVRALGLGDITLHSALNQPLDADIDLLSVRPGEADGMLVGLASRELFERMGLERPFVLSQLKFKVITGTDGKPHIHVSSAQAVREPFLDFLLDVSWTNGKLQREYTVLLDPPALMPARAPVRQTPAVSQGPAAMPQPIPAPVVREPASVYAAPGGTYGPVQRAETLWQIANRVRSDQGISVEQMMQGLLRANPEAFIDANINNLKAGQVLRIPGTDELVSQSEAVRLTREQNMAWRQARQKSTRVAESGAPATAAQTGDVQSVTAPPEETAPQRAKATASTAAAAGAAPSGQEKAAAPATEAAVKNEGRLELVAPERESEAAGTVTAGAPGAAEDSLRKELALATEAVETQRQETQELRYPPLGIGAADCHNAASARVEERSACRARAGAGDA